MNNVTIGFIGLGIMGKPMARNLLKAGYSLVVHSRSRPPVDELAKEGAQTAGNSEEVAARADVLITMLPNSPDVELVYTGERGVFAQSRVLDAHGQKMLAAMKFTGRSDLDHAGLVTLVEDLSKTELTQKFIA